MLRWIFILLFAASFSVAQTPVLSIKSALALALKQSTSLALSRSQKDLAQVGLDKQKSGWQPTLTAGTDLENDKTLNNNLGNQLDWAANLTLIEKLDPTTSANIKSQEQAFHASEKDLSSTEEATIVAVLASYLTALRDSMLESVQVDNVTLQEQKLAQLQAFEKAGTYAHSAVLQQQATLAQAKVALLNARTAYSNGIADLFTAMGIDTSANPNIALQTLPPKLWQSISAQDSVPNLTLSEDPSIAAQQARIESARSALDASQKSYWPSLQFMAALNHNDIIAQTPASLQYTTPFMTEVVKLQAALTINIFDQNSRNAQVLANQIQIETAQTQLKALQITASANLSKAQREFNSAQKKLAATKEAKDAADLVLADMQANFKVGTANVIDLHTVELQQQQAASDEVQAEYDLWIADVDLSKSVHRLADFTNELD